MGQREKPYHQALEKARRDLGSLDPEAVAYRADARYDARKKTLALRFLGVAHEVGVGDGTVRAVDIEEQPDIVTQLLVLHYLTTADGSPMADQWVSFREIPGALTYYPAFAGRTSARLIRAFGHDLSAFVGAAEALDGERLTFGDASYMFRLLPRLRMTVILHLGDEEFAPEVTVLFDGAAWCYLPIEDLAVLGGVLTSRLIKAGKDG